MKWRQLIISGLVVVACSCGCREQSTEKKRRESLPVRHDVLLNVLVVDDLELATGVKLLRGEWAQRSGGQLKVQPWTSEEFAAALSQTKLSQTDLALPADIIIYPSRYLGALASSKAVRPVRQSILRGPHFARADLFPAIRDREINFGDKVIALPLGSPPLLLCYNPKLFEKAGLVLGPATGPALLKTWEDYRRIQQQLVQNGYPCILPLSENTAAFTLLARAVSYASRRQGDALLFDADSFRPLIAGPPFVRALKEMADELRGQRLEDSLNADFAGAVEAVATGQAAITLGWPGVARPGVDGNAQFRNAQFHVNYAELPRAINIYNATRNQWGTNRSESPITLLGATGRLASVTAASRNATSAFKLLEWLCCGKTATQLSSRSRQTLWHRGSQLSVAERWLTVPQQKNRAIAQLTAKALRREACFLVPRIPGIDQYLASLSGAVRRAVQGEDAAVALQQAAQRWSEITERYGPESQLGAYRQHLGL